MGRRYLGCARRIALALSEKKKSAKSHTKVDFRSLMECEALQIGAEGTYHRLVGALYAL